jgi:lactate dehydrogenase-like 2-hydroxyacid dehydrogenase
VALIGTASPGPRACDTGRFSWERTSHPRLRRSSKPDQFPLSQQKLLYAAEGADALFITPADRLDSGFFEKVSPTIKIIATYSVGFEHIDVEAAARRKISVAYTPGVNSEATADIAMLLLLGASRRAYEAQELVRKGEWKPLSPDMLLGWQVGGKILGIFGMGRVGQALARRARGFVTPLSQVKVS